MVLATVAAILAGAISITGTNTCPTGEAVSAELDRLGALAALRQVGTAEVAVGDSQLHIVIRDRQGIALGGRDVSAPADCAARASLAAVLIAAWAGDWIETKLGKPVAAPQPEARASSETHGGSGRPATPTRPPTESVPPPAAPAAISSVALTVAPTPTAAPTPTVAPIPTVAPTPPVVRAQVVARAAPTPIHVDLGLLAFGVHDGDAGTFGIGGQAALFAKTLSLVALVEGTGERQRALEPGQAGYSSLRLGLGGGARKSWTSLFVDFALAPEIVRHALRGTGLTQSNSVTAWGVEADGRARLGWSAGWGAPFLYLGASWSLLREHLTLTDRSDSITLSRANLAAGLGISFMVR